MTLLKGSALLTLFFIVGCSKPEIKKPVTSEPVNTQLQNGLPASPDSVHGYLYASQWFSMMPGFNTHTLTVYASFREPAGNLPRLWNHRLDYQSAVAMGDDAANIVLKSLVYNETTVGNTNANPNSIYLLKTFVPEEALINRAHWISEGNISFKAFDVDLSGRYPLPLDSAEVVSASRTTGKTWDMDTFFTNYDSAGFRISNAINFQKVVSKKFRFAVLSSQNLGNWATGDTLEISFVAYRYAHVTIEDKRYLFELSRKYRKRLAITE